MTPTQLLSLWLASVAQAHRRYQNKHAIHRTERDLELTCREIADRLAAKRTLQIDLMNLKRERNSI